ncbi:MAG: hypothetical protein Q8O89_07065 [Nanoarchaeota archaeon]|nr:hypothetical protein [Nanoarchaeota archaeon]
MIRDLFKDEKEIVKLTFDGKETTSIFSKDKYVYYECTAYFPDDSYTHVLFTQDELIADNKGKKISIGINRIRLKVNPAHEIKSDEIKKNAKNNSQAAQAAEAVKSLLTGQKEKKLTLKEYGLKKNKKYYAMLDFETYHLPPKDEKSEPEEKRNAVLIISDEKLPNNIEVTPRFKHWSY